MSDLHEGDLVTIEGCKGAWRAVTVMVHDGITATRLVCAECGADECEHVEYPRSEPVESE